MATKHIGGWIVRPPFFWVGWLCAGLLVTGWAHGQAKGQADVAATVNGSVISLSSLNRVVNANVERGFKDSPDLRKAILEELIARELFVQAALEKGLDKASDVQDRLAEIRRDVLAEGLVADDLKTRPISDAELQAEYRRQLALLEGAQEYLLRQIVVADEVQARSLVAQLRKNESFDKLARENSLDPSKDKGGVLGWIPSTDILPEIGNVVANLNKGGLTSVPIRTQQGWHIVQLDDVRPLKPAGFEESKDRIRLIVLQNRRVELLTRLRERATIVR